MGRHAATFGDEFGLARMGEADAVKLLLRHRRGDDAARRPRPGQADGRLQRLERGAGALCGRLARRDRPGMGDLKAGQGGYKGVDRLFRAVDDADWPTPDGAQGSGIAHREKGRQAAHVAHHPAFGDDLWPDPGGVAQRYGKGGRRISYSR